MSQHLKNLLDAIEGQAKELRRRADHLDIQDPEIAEAIAGVSLKYLEKVRIQFDTMRRKQS